MFNKLKILLSARSDFNNGREHSYIHGVIGIVVKRLERKIDEIIQQPDNDNKPLSSQHSFNFAVFNLTAFNFPFFSDGVIKLGPKRRDKLMRALKPLQDKCEEHGISLSTVVEPGRDKKYDTYPACLKVTISRPSPENI
jgi:hypothetical protein